MFGSYDTALRPFVQKISTKMCIGLRFMGMNTFFLAIQPFVSIGGGGLLSWLISLLILCVVVSVIVWLVTKFAGPPNIPEPFRWIIWVVVGIALLVLILGAFGVRI